MNKEAKHKIAEELSAQLSAASYFYIMDAEGLSVASVNDFRRRCYKQKLTYKVVKNTLIKKALDRIEGGEELYAEFNKKVLKGFSGILMAEEGVASGPAKLLKAFRKDKGLERPLLKGAFFDGSFYYGDQSIEELSKLKSKEELIGDVLLLLQSPLRRVVASLESGKGKLSGILVSLSTREEGKE